MLLPASIVPCLGATDMTTQTLYVLGLLRLLATPYTDVGEHTWWACSVCQAASDAGEPTEEQVKDQQSIKAFIDQYYKLDEEITELRERDRVLSHQLDLRAQGKDPYTQAIMKERDDLLERVTSFLREHPEYSQQLDPTRSV